MLSVSRFAKLRAMKLIEYIKSEHGRASRLAREINSNPVSVHEWATEKKPVPARFCPRIEKATNGQVTCEELNPDVDWAYLRKTKRKAA